VHNVCRLVEFFSTPQLTRVALWDQKLGKPYGAAFVRALERLGLPRSSAAR
jgi:nitric oxide synthase oxygenase domain/subunit